MSCRCSDPRERADPRSAGICSKCGKVIGSGVLSSDETVKWFFDRLEAASFPGKVPDDFRAFRQGCETRERAGRSTFGLAYLCRPNLPEAQQEWADGANYIFFDALRNRRATGQDEDLDVALSVAYHAYMADHFTRLLASKRRGGL